LRTGLHSFELPVPAPPITVSLFWHPRLDGDPAHRWLRGCVREVCAGASQASPTRDASGNA
jgi:DNA-binding transcriptional LysR family regulator